MGGKSTYCRSVAIAFIMAQLGSFVPAAEARLPIRDRVFARVGASDDLRGGQSTFMMEMQEVAHIVKYATEDSLVILDEVGRGTGTFDGLSVAWAVSEYLISQLHTKALFATHYLELTQMAQKFANVQNLVLVVEEKGEQIVFLHKILPGSANKSYGIHVARLAGLPEPIIEKATTVLAELEDSKEFRGAGTTVDLVVQERQDQMQLFAEYNQQKNPQKIPEAVIADKAKLNHPILQALLKKNLANMTPIEGLNYLFTIQKQLQE
jgi:DNA mismatch repair protein MutS